jgi:hypothetical protein
VIARHESLRTIFPNVDGVPLQEVLAARAGMWRRGGAAVVSVPEQQLAGELAALAGHRFDLSTEIPIRAQIYSVGSEQYVVGIVVHHIAFDGWSLAPMVRDMGEAYRARRHSRAPQWTPLPANSKWAGEVLLREANDLCALPVAVFRCGMILADTTYTGQLNVSDMFTRTILSVVATGVAPGSFYQLDADGNRQRAHFDGLPVEFVAEAIATLGTQPDTSLAGFQTYHVMNPHDDGIGLDEYVDWLIEAGYPIQRISDIGEWLQRFEAGLRALPARRRQHSLLWTSPLHNSNPLHNSIHFQVAEPRCGSAAPTDRFRAAVQEAKIGLNKNNPDIPHVSPAIIIKYVTDLQRLGLLARPPIRGDDPRRSICSMPRVRSRCKPTPSSSFGLMQDSTELD